VVNDNISKLLQKMLRALRNRDIEAVRTDGAVIISELDVLLEPVLTGRGTSSKVSLAVQQGYGIPKVRDVRTLVSEARSLFSRAQQHAAEQAMIRAISRWSDSAD
jgi:hypothetical protein